MKGLNTLASVNISTDSNFERLTSNNFVEVAQEEQYCKAS